MPALVFTIGAWGAIETLPVTIGGTDGDRFPCAVEDASGGIWLVWVRGPLGTGDIYCARRDPVTSIWGQPRLLTSTFADDSAPFTLLAPDQSIWAFWSSTRTGDTDLFFKRIFTAV
jgi:hypothetical protein